MTGKILAGHRRGGMAVVAALSLLAGLVVVPGISGASHPERSLTGSNFEIDTDANLKVDDPAPNIDWLAEGSGTALRSGVVSKDDLASGTSDDSFGQGTKEESAVPTVVSGSIPPNKSDLKKFGIFNETTDTASFLHLFWSRVQDPSGTTNMDFEFNKNKCDATDLTHSVCSSNGVTPTRSEGDLLITYDLSNGGTKATISKREWTGSAWGAATAFGDGTAVGTINTSAVPATEAGSVGALSARTFGEASIDLAAIFDSDVCESFGSAYLKSRSSDSFTAAVKDFIAPQPVSLTNCGTVNIHKQDDSATPNPLAGVAFTLYADNAPTGGSRGAEDTATAYTCTTGGTGDCTISNLLFGEYWAVEGTPPAGYTAAPDQHVSLTRANATVSLTFTDNRQPSSLAIHKQDDDDPANPLPGVVFTLYRDIATVGGSRGAEDTVTTFTCTTNSAGDCTISNILPAGDFWVVETTSKPGYDAAADQHVTLALGQTVTTPLVFVNPRNFKVIVLVCNESENKLYPSSVTIDGTAVANSLSGAGATSASLSESALCGLSAGAAGGKDYGSHSAGVVIPQ